MQDIPVNENRIKQLHQILLRHSDKDARRRGQYKTHSNSVAAFDENGSHIGIVFETATPFDTPRLMAELVAWVNDERGKAQLHPLLTIAIFVVVFFGDSSIPGWQWPTQPGADNLAAAAGRLCLCALQFPGKRDRAQQGTL